jgi:hypothetical protein
MVSRLGVFFERLFGGFSTFSSWLAKTTAQNAALRMALEGLTKALAILASAAAVAGFASLARLAIGFALGDPYVEDSGLQERLQGSALHGDSLPALNSTYVQDVVICADAALSAALPDQQVEGIWIEYALDPLVSSLAERDLGVVDIGSSDAELEWRDDMFSDPLMMAAIRFVEDSIQSLEVNGVALALVDELVLRGAVLLPFP